MSQEKPQGRPTTDELIMYRDMLILPHLVTMLEHQRKEIELSPQMLKTLYMQAVDALLYIVNRDISKLRQELRKRGIKTWHVDSTDAAIYLGADCRGYRENFPIIKEVAKAQIQLRLTRYIKDMGVMLQEGSHALSSGEYKLGERPKELKANPRGQSAGI